MRDIITIEDIEYNDTLIDVQVEFNIYHSNGYLYDNNLDGSPDDTEVEILEITNIENGQLIRESELTSTDLSMIEEEIIQHYI